MSIDDSGNHRFTLGEHEARLDNIERRAESIEAKLDRILAVTDQARGSWRTLAVIGGSMAAAVEIAHQVVAWAHAKP